MYELERFRGDPEWAEVKRNSEEDGPLIKKQERIFLKDTVFFNHKSN